jgi:polyphosphate kinase 2 (PPK2 family)
LTRCSTPDAPWFVVPADNKAVRNYLVAKMLVDTLESLHPSYPAMQEAVRAAARNFT